MPASRIRRDAKSSCAASSDQPRAHEGVAPDRRRRAIHVVAEFSSISVRLSASSGDQVRLRGYRPTAGVPNLAAAPRTSRAGSTVCSHSRASSPLQ